MTQPELGELLGQLGVRPSRPEIELQLHHATSRLASGASWSSVRLPSFVSRTRPPAGEHGGRADAHAIEVHDRAVVVDRHRLVPAARRSPAFFVSVFESPLTTVTKPHPREVARIRSTRSTCGSQSAPRVDDEGQHARASRSVGQTFTIAAAVHVAGRAPCRRSCCRASCWQTFASPSRSPARRRRERGQRLARPAARSSPLPLFGSVWANSSTPSPIRSHDPHHPGVLVARPRHLGPAARGSGWVRSRSASRSPISRPASLAAQVARSGPRSRRVGAGHAAPAAPPARAGRGSREAAPCSSAHRSAPRAAPSSRPAATRVRSTTVTMPKSRSIRMSEAISAAKPAIAVAPEASTAAPGGRVGQLDRPARGRRRRSRSWR